MDDSASYGTDIGFSEPLAIDVIETSGLEPGGEPFVTTAERFLDARPIGTFGSEHGLGASALSFADRLLAWTDDSPFLIDPLARMGGLAGLGIGGWLERFEHLAGQVLQGYWAMAGPDMAFLPFEEAADSEERRLWVAWREQQERDELEEKRQKRAQERDEWRAAAAEAAKAREAARAPRHTESREQARQQLIELRAQERLTGKVEEQQRLHEEQQQRAALAAEKAEARQLADEEERASALAAIERREAQVTAAVAARRQRALAEARAQEKSSEERRERRTQRRRLAQLARLAREAHDGGLAAQVESVLGLVGPSDAPAVPAEVVDTLSERVRQVQRQSAARASAEQRVAQREESERRGAAKTLTALHRAAAALPDPALGAWIATVREAAEAGRSVPTPAELATVAQRVAEAQRAAVTARRAEVAEESRATVERVRAEQQARAQQRKAETVRRRVAALGRQARSRRDPALQAWVGKLTLALLSDDSAVPGPEQLIAAERRIEEARRLAAAHVQAQRVPMRPDLPRSPGPDVPARPIPSRAAVEPEAAGRPEGILAAEVARLSALPPERRVAELARVSRAVRDARGTPAPALSSTLARLMRGALLSSDAGVDPRLAGATRLVSGASSLARGLVRAGRSLVATVREVERDQPTPAAQQVRPAAPAGAPVDTAQVRPRAAGPAQPATPRTTVDLASASGWAASAARGAPAPAAVAPLLRSLAPQLPADQTAAIILHARQAALDAASEEAARASTDRAEPAAVEASAAALPPESLAALGGGERATLTEAVRVAARAASKAAAAAIGRTMAARVGAQVASEAATDLVPLAARQAAEVVAAADLSAAATPALVRSAAAQAVQSAERLVRERAGARIASLARQAALDAARAIPAQTIEHAAAEAAWQAAHAAVEAAMASGTAATSERIRSLASKAAREAAARVAADLGQAAAEQVRRRVAEVAATAYASAVAREAAQTGLAALRSEVPLAGERAEGLTQLSTSQQIALRQALRGDVGTSTRPREALSRALGRRGGFVGRLLGMGLVSPDRLRLFGPAALPAAVRALVSETLLLPGAVTPAASAAPPAARAGIDPAQPWAAPTSPEALLAWQHARRMGVERWSSATPPDLSGWPGAGAEGAPASAPGRASLTRGAAGGWRQPDASAAPAFAAVGTSQPGAGVWSRLEQLGVAEGDVGTGGASKPEPPASGRPGQRSLPPALRSLMPRGMSEAARQAALRLTGPGFTMPGSDDVGERALPELTRWFRWHGETRSSELTGFLRWVDWSAAKLPAAGRASTPPGVVVTPAAGPVATSEDLARPTPRSLLEASEGVPAEIKAAIEALSATVLDRPLADLPPEVAGWVRQAARAGLGSAEQQQALLEHLPAGIARSGWSAATFSGAVHGARAPGQAGRRAARFLPLLARAARAAAPAMLGAARAFLPAGMVANLLADGRGSGPHGALVEALLEQLPVDATTAELQLAAQAAARPLLAALLSDLTLTPQLPALAEALGSHDRATSPLSLQAVVSTVAALRARGAVGLASALERALPRAATLALRATGRPPMADQASRGEAPAQEATPAARSEQMVAALPSLGFVGYPMMPALAHSVDRKLEAGVLAALRTGVASMGYLGLLRSAASSGDLPGAVLSIFQARGVGAAQLLSSGPAAQALRQALGYDDSGPAPGAAEVPTPPDGAARRDPAALPTVADAQALAALPKDLGVALRDEAGPGGSPAPVLARWLQAAIESGRFSEPSQVRQLVGALERSVALRPLARDPELVRLATRAAERATAALSAGRRGTTTGAGPAAGGAALPGVGLLGPRGAAGTLPPEGPGAPSSIRSGVVRQQDQMSPAESLATKTARLPGVVRRWLLDAGSEGAAGLAIALPAERLADVVGALGDLEGLSPAELFSPVALAGAAGGGPRAATRRSVDLSGLPGVVLRPEGGEGAEYGAGTEPEPGGRPGLAGLGGEPAAAGVDPSSEEPGPAGAASGRVVSVAGVRVPLRTLMRLRRLFPREVPVALLHRAADRYPAGVPSDKALEQLVAEVAAQDSGLPIGQAALAGEQAALGTELGGRVGLGGRVETESLRAAFAQLGRGLLATLQTAPQRWVSMGLSRELVSMAAGGESDAVRQVLDRMLGTSWHDHAPQLVEDVTRPSSPGGEAPGFAGFDIPMQLVARKGVPARSLRRAAREESRAMEAAKAAQRKREAQRAHEEHATAEQRSARRQSQLKRTIELAEKLFPQAAGLGQFSQAPGARMPFPGFMDHPIPVDLTLVAPMAQQIELQAAPLYSKESQDKYQQGSDAESKRALTSADKPGKLDKYLAPEQISTMASKLMKEIEQHVIEANDIRGFDPFRRR